MWAPPCHPLPIPTISKHLANSWHHTAYPAYSQRVWCHDERVPKLVHQPAQATIAATNGAALRIRAALDALEADNLAAQRLPVNIVTVYELCYFHCLS